MCYRRKNVRGGWDGSDRPQLELSKEHFGYLSISSTRNPRRRAFRSNARPHVGHRSAFSLVEIMVVLVIIGLLAGVVTMNVRQYLISAKQNTARMEIATIVDALETYYTMHDRYPSNEEGIEALTRPSNRIAEPLLKQLPMDPWGRRYQYNQPGRDGPYEVISFGADGREGGEPGSADADISSSQLKEVSGER